MKRVALALIIVVALAAALRLYRRPSAPVAAKPAPAARAGHGELGPRPKDEREAPRAVRLSGATATAVDATASALGGRVLSTRDGKPIARAALTFLHGGAALSVESDGAGHFAIAPAAAGAYELTSALADGYVPFEPQLGHSPLTLFARSGMRIEDADIYLTPTLTLTVHVRDQADHAVAGAEVRAISSTGRAAAGAPVVSDARGDAHVVADPDGLIEAHKPGFHRGRQRISQGMRTTHTMTLVLTPGSDAPSVTLAGRVVDTGGQPVDGALVETWTTEWKENAPERTQVLSGADGRFFFGELDDGRYTVRASARGLGSVVSADVAPNSRDLLLQLGSPLAGLSGVVRDGSGKPVTAFNIVALPRVGLFGRGHDLSAAVVDPQGRYRLEMAPGTYEVSVAAHGFATSVVRAITVGDEAATADFTLVRGGRISGVVTDRKSGAPLAGADVQLEGEATQGQVATDNLTAADGSFRVDGVGPGAHSLAVQAEGHDGRIVSGLRVAENGETGPLTIDLAATAPGEEPKTELVGVGAVLGADPEGMIFKSVVPGGGAAAAGIQPGDRVIAIDGQSVDQMGFGAAIQLIRGPENSVVGLTVDRGGTIAVIPVTRKRITS